MDDQQETTWEQIAKDAEFPADEAAALAERERTTVTKKIRRVATQSWTLLADAARATGATKLILNFPQYIHWSAYKASGGREAFARLHPKVREYVAKMEDVTGLPCVMIGTSAEHDDYIWLG
jgi:adenylosuccinate synthase